MALGGSQQLKGSVTFNDGTSQDVTALVTWSSSNISTLVVSSSGTAVGAATGSATVSATFTSPSGPTASNSTSITVH
jgi:hypothetical protein